LKLPDLAPVDEYPLVAAPVITAARHGFPDGPTRVFPAQAYNAELREEHKITLPVLYI
jgi:hypothetical protein